MPPIRVVVSGTGRMGKEVLLGVCRDPDVEPVGVLEKFSQEEYLSLPDGSGLVPLANEPEALFARTRPDVVVDFTNAEWTERVVRAALAVGARPVIGTTGLSDDFVRDLERECRERRLGGVIAANFAIGAVLLMHLAAVASRYFEHAEIIELHHDQKVDAPSGTSVSTARRMLDARQGRPFTHPETEKFTLPGARGAETGGIAVHSVRLPGLVAHQEVIFGGQGETLTIRHDTISRESFIPGVLTAVKDVVRREELVLGLDRLMGLP